MNKMLESFLWSCIVPVVAFAFGANVLIPGPTLGTCIVVQLVVFFFIYHLFGTTDEHKNHE